MTLLIRLLGSFIAVLAVASCASQATAPTAAPPTAPTSNPAALTQKEAIALAEKFYILLFDKQDYATAVALFDDKMKEALPESSLKEVWDSLPQQVGAFKSRADAKTAERQDQYERVIIPLQFEKMAVDMLVVVDTHAGKISGLFFQPNQGAQADQYKSPAYVDPNKFEEEEVTFGADPWTLPGTLALP